MSAPNEIVAAPFTIWWAPVGTAFPAIDDATVTGFTKIGTSGDRNYSEDGVVVVHEQTIEMFRPLGTTGPVKASRTQETLIIRFTLWDLLLEQYKLALNSNVVSTTVAGGGTAGFKEIDLYRNLDVVLMALLARGGFSPEGDGWNTQYQVPVCFQSGTPEPVFAKGAPAALALEFTALEDPNAAGAAKRFGQLIVQHQDPV